MPHAPNDPLANAIQLALRTRHQHLAEVSGLARRYPGEVAPFASVDDLSAEAMSALHSLMQHGETVFVANDEPPPEIPGLSWSGTVPCFQMAFGETAALPFAKPQLNTRIAPLTCENADEMLDLIAIAFPGYFRRRTCEMGEYFGIRSNSGELLAMGGERIILDADGKTFREISGVCTHPEHRGKGYAHALMVHLMQLHREQRAISWLHVVTDNPAFAMYQAMGFDTLREVQLNRLVRVD